MVILGWEDFLSVPAANLFSSMFLSASPSEKSPWTRVSPISSSPFPGVAAGHPGKQVKMQLGSENWVGNEKLNQAMASTLALLSFSGWESSFSWLFKDYSVQSKLTPLPTLSAAFNKAPTKEKNARSRDPFLWPCIIPQIRNVSHSCVPEGTPLDKLIPQQKS